MVAVDQFQRTVLPISLETLLLFTFGALDLVWLRGVLPLPAWTVLANAFWIFTLPCLISDMRPRSFPLLSWWKTVGMAVAVVLLVGGSTVSLIVLRHKSDPTAYVHDNAILIEEGVKQLAAGRNFYAADYRSTALARWQNGRFYDATAQVWFENPALQHYITLPFYTAASLPVAWASAAIFGWYDQRMTHLLLFGVLAAAVWGLSRRSLPAVVLAVLNPLLFPGVVMGTSDIFVLALLLLSAWLFTRQKPLLGAAALGLACASKQTAWLVIPFLVAYWYGVRRSAGQKPRAAAADCARQLWPCLAVFAAWVLPFFAWDPLAFVDDTYRYPAGLLSSSYPIYGYGMSVLLQLFGFPASPRGYFPYHLLQLLLAGPILAALLFWQRRDNSMGRALVSTGVFLLVFWWLSRFFNENYLGVIAVLLGLGYILGEENSKYQIPNPKQIQNSNIELPKF